MYSVDQYGAKGDGITNDAKAIQAAIDDCASQGGGRVVLSGGKVYLSGSVLLKSNVELHLESGCVLKASSDLKDYHALANNGEIVAHASGLPSYLNCEYAGKPFHAFIYSYGEVNVRVSGFGTIDGNESMFYGVDSGYHIEGTYYPRVPLLLLEDIKHLTVKEVTLANCAFWTLHMVGCEDVLVDGIRILNNLRMANSDGIDPDHCKNVRIQNCHIECGDDCIVLKNTKDYEYYGATENITISSCTLISTSAAIKFGTEGECDFRNIVVNNCTISRSNRGISLQIRDCGNVENVSFSNMTIETRRFSEEWWGRAEPICITVLNRKEGVKAGKVKNITFRDIHCKGENGILLRGSEDNYIEDIRFHNVRVELVKTSKWPIEGYDIRPCTMDGKIKGNISGIYADYVKNVNLQEVSVEVNQSMKPYVGELKKYLHGIELES